MRIVRTRSQRLFRRMVRLAQLRYTLPNAWLGTVDLGGMPRGRPAREPARDLN